MGEAQRGGTPECPEPAACSGRTRHSEQTRNRGTALPGSRMSNVSASATTAPGEETELFSVVAETAALAENGVNIQHHQQGRLIFPSFTNDIRIPKELGQLLTMAHAESWDPERQFPLLDARLLYRMDSFVSERLLFTGRCALGGRYVAVEINRISVSGGKQTVWFSPQDIRTGTPLELPFTLPAETLVARGFQDKPGSGDRAVLTCLEAGDRPVLSPLPAEQLPVFRRAAFKVSVQVLSVQVAVSHSRGSPIFITRLVFHEPVSNRERPLFQSITGSDTFIFIAALNDSSPLVATAAHDLLKSRPVCVLERTDDSASLSLQCDAAEALEGYADIRDVLQKKRILRRERNVTRGIFWAAALFCLAVLFQGLRLNPDVRYTILMDRTLSRPLEARGISNRMLLSFVDAVHPPNIETARWILGDPVSHLSGPEWRRELMGFLMKGAAAWGLAINVALRLCWQMVFRSRERHLRALETQRKEARARKLKLRSSTHPRPSRARSVTVLLLVDSPST